MLKNQDVLQPRPRPPPRPQRQCDSQLRSLQLPTATRARQHLLWPRGWRQLRRGRTATDLGGQSSNAHHSLRRATQGCACAASAHRRSGASTAASSPGPVASTEHHFHRATAAPTTSTTPATTALTTATATAVFPSICYSIAPASAASGKIRWHCNLRLEEGIDVALFPHFSR